MLDLVERDPNGIRLIYRTPELVFGTMLLGRILPAGSYLFGFILPNCFMLVDYAPGIEDFLKRIKAPDMQVFLDKDGDNLLLFERTFGTRHKLQYESTNMLAMREPTRIVGFTAVTDRNAHAPVVITTRGEWFSLPEIINFLHHSLGW